MRAGAIALALFAGAVCFGNGLIQHHLGYEQGKTQGQIDAAYDVSMDGDMEYLICLAPPPHCDKQHAVAEWAEAWAHKRLTKLGVDD